MDFYEDLHKRKLFRFRSSKTLVFIVAAIAVTVNEILYCALGMLFIRTHSVVFLLKGKIWLAFIAPIAPDILFRLATRLEANSSIIESHFSKPLCCQNQSAPLSEHASLDDRSQSEPLITRDRRNMILEQVTLMILLRTLIV